MVIGLVAKIGRNLLPTTIAASDVHIQILYSFQLRRKRFFATDRLTQTHTRTNKWMMIHIRFPQRNRDRSIRFVHIHFSYVHVVVK